MSSPPAQTGVDRRTLIALAAGVATAAAAPPPPTERTGDTETIRLWPGDPPGSPPALPQSTLRKEAADGKREFRLRGVAAPVMFVYRPAKPNGAAVIAMPGGAYAFLSVQGEGTAVAKRLTEWGYTVLVLSYRLPGEGWTNRADTPLQDAIRAMRLVRAKAAELKVDPGRIGVLGFSAGGHLAASVATAWNEPLYEPLDDADRGTARPAFAGLIYPVTTLQPPCADVASRRNLLGPEADMAAVIRRSPLAHVTKDMPPVFLAHAFDDPVVNPACSLAFVGKLREAAVPVEAHFFEKGGHGFGMGLPETLPGSLWPELFHRWVSRHGG